MKYLSRVDGIEYEVSFYVSNLYKYFYDNQAELKTRLIKETVKLINLHHNIVYDLSKLHN